jgi:type VII secretion integral membrane protein EccD
MATRFTRLSVVAGDRQLDTSLPASRPVAEFLAHLPGLLSLEPTAPPTAWALSTPRHGPISPERTLDDVGVLDGDVLYLSPAVNAAESPIVDDVLVSIADEVDRATPPWRGVYRDRAVSYLAAVVVLAMGAALYGVPARVPSAVLLVAAAAGCLAAAALLRAHVAGPAMAWISPLFVGLAVVRMTSGVSLGARVTAVVAAGGLGLGAAAWVRRRHTLRVAGITAGVLAGITALLLGSGVDARSVAAWASPVLVFALAVLPQVALSASGLVGLVQRGEQGDAVPRAGVARRLKAAAARVEGTVVVVAVATSAATLTLIWSGRPAHATLGLLLALIVGLRSRGFAAATQVGYLLAAPVLALVAVVFALPSWLGVTSPVVAATDRVVGLLLVLGLVASVGYARLQEVNAARVSRLLDLLDTLAVIALVPAVLLAQDVFGWLIRHL